MEIIIDGERFDVDGNNIVITESGTAKVNGKVIKTGLKDEVRVRFEGDLANIDCTNLVVEGSVNGDVDCTNLKVGGDITGDVDATNVKCKNIGGDVDAKHVVCKAKK